ncbi:hypothetical protein V8E36_006997 [Tilletia maclaganii]
MQLFTPVAIATAVLATFATAAPADHVLVARADPGLPSNDAFYKPSGNITSKANGAILKSRSITPNAQNAAKGYQLLYKTTDALGNADATVVTILVPKSPKSPAKIVSLQLPEDSVSIDCAPSGSLAKGTSSPAAASLSTTNQGLEGSLQNGYYVVIPDHEGSKAQAFVGPTEGRAVLDALLAVTSYTTGIPGVSKSTPIAIGGYSGGAHATAWAAQLYKSYAPSLNILGQIIGGTPVNLTSTLLYLNGKTFAGFAAVGIVGEYKAYSDIKSYVDANIRSNGTALIKELQTNKCLTSVAFGYSKLDLFTVFKNKDPRNNSVVKKRLQQNLLGNNGAKLPFGTIMYHGTTDDHIQEMSSRGASLAGWFDEILSGKADFSCNL